MNEEAAKALRAPFPDSAIGKLPRAGITLDFVGHADVTDRLLAVDPEWTWEPVAFAEDGAPLIRNDGKVATLWIKLTVCGVTRYGVGNEVPSKFDLEKLLISDALRNAAMRFGVALDLWRRGELDDRPGNRAPSPPAGIDPATGEVGPLTAETISSMKPRELHDALAARGLEQGGSLPEQRDRLWTWNHAQSPGAGDPTDVDEAPSDADEPVVSSPAPVPGDGVAGNGPLEGEPGDTPATLALEGSSPGPIDGYEDWTRAGLMTECASRGVDTLSNATKATLIEQLRAWDRLHPAEPAF